VQVGDPFQEKLLIECTLEAFAEKLFVGIQDLGAAGCLRTSELASTAPADAGRVGRRTAARLTLSPEEILMSECRSACARS